MKAHTASRINAIILIVIGAWGYVESGSLTSNIPVFIGLVLLLLNKGIKNQNKLIAHIAVILTLLSFANIIISAPSPFDISLSSVSLEIIVSLLVSTILKKKYTFITLETLWVVENDDLLVLLK